MYNIDLYSEETNFINKEEAKEIIKFHNNYEYRIINGIYGQYADGTEMPKYSPFSCTEWDATISDDIISESVSWKFDCENYDMKNQTTKIILNRLLKKYRKFDPRYKNTYVSITRLGEKSYISSHVDIMFGAKNIPDGTITAVIYLQPAEEGGELLIDNDIVVFPRQFSLVEFFGYKTFHEVKRVNKGNRYTFIAGFGIN